MFGFAWRRLLRGTYCGVLLLVAGAWGEEVRVDSVQSRPSISPRVRAPRSAAAHTVEAVRWMSRRRQFTLRGIPYGFTGLPFIFFSPNTGWNYGVRLHWVDYRRRPYRYKLTMHLQRSSVGTLKNRLRLKVPRISGTGFGLRLEFIRGRNLRTRYYGMGNKSEYNLDYIDPENAYFKDKNYYNYVLEKDPRILMSLLRHVYGPIGMSVGFGLERIDVDRRGTRAFYLEEGRPDGALDGFSGFISATLLWDTRDDEIVPQSGFFQEWSYESARNSFLGLFFDQINFRRLTLTTTYYIPLSPRWNFSHRTVLEKLSGVIPLYVYGEIGGSRRVKGLGGSGSLRGFDTQRFTDNVRFFSNAEFRYRLYDRWVYKQHIECLGMVFFDSGRVWANLDQIGLSGMHVSGGAGMRIIWNADFVIRMGIGVAGEQTDVWLGLGQNF